MSCYFKSFFDLAFAMSSHVGLGELRFAQAPLRGGASAGSGGRGDVSAAGHPPLALQNF